MAQAKKLTHFLQTIHKSLSHTFQFLSDSSEINAPFSCGPMSTLGRRSSTLIASWEVSASASSPGGLSSFLFDRPLIGLGGFSPACCEGKDDKFRIKTTRR